MKNYILETCVVCLLSAVEAEKGGARHVDLEQVIELKYDTILPGGQALSAWDGRDILKKLHKKSQGRIEILTAGGICRKVIEKLLPYTGITFYHMSGKIEIESTMKYRKPGASMMLPERDEYKLFKPDISKVRAAVDFLPSYPD